MSAQHPQAARSLDDPRIIEQVDAYRSALLKGQNPDRRELLDQFPEVAHELDACLNALEFLRQLAPVVHQQVTESGGEIGGLLPGPAPRALGDFCILREIGRGGMGVVYEAEQISLGRRMALKVLPFAAVLDQRRVQRFQNEARAAASLKHPSIVGVHSVGCERGVHYYAMEYVEGRTLAEVIRRLRGARGQGSGTRDQGPGARGGDFSRHSFPTGQG